MKFIAKKLVQLVAVLILVTFLTFLLITQIPGGDDIAVITVAGPGASSEQAEEIKEDLGLNDMVLVGYGKWLGNALQGDLGESFNTKSPVTDYLFNRLPLSLRLMIYAQIIGLAISIPLGILSAYREDSIFDKTSNSTAFGLLALPNFIIGVLLVYFFAVRLGWFPAIGRDAPLFDDPAEHFKQFLLPSLTLALPLVAIYTRLLRADMLATLKEDFIGVAKAKGMPTWHILLRHALRPSSFSLITVAGISVGQLIGGSIIVEQIYGLEGMGAAIIRAIFQRDYLVVQGAVVLICVAFVLVNFVVDLLYAVLDPRIRHARAIA